APWWRDLFEDVTTVQFEHRMVAYLLLAVAITHAVQTWRTMRGSGHARRAAMLAALVLAQATIGVVTLLLVVPLPMALAHQFGAVAVLIGAVAHLRAMTPPMGMEPRPAAAAVVPA